jgi:hypothetical protein
MIYPCDELLGDMTVKTALEDRGLQEMDIVKAGSNKKLLIESDDLKGVEPDLAEYIRKNAINKQYLKKEDMKGYLKQSSFDGLEIVEDLDDDNIQLAVIYKDDIRLIRIGDIVKIGPKIIGREET